MTADKITASGPEAGYNVKTYMNEAKARLAAQEANLAGIEVKPMEASGRPSPSREETDGDDANSFDLKARLVDKSLEAYVLALETINRLTIQYRLESFCYLFCNAWELLLKAKILDDKVDPESIHYKDQPKRTLSLRDCLNRTIPNQKDPTRRNIERIEELRDDSVHLVISSIPSDVMCLFQAGVINYHRHLNKWFGKSLADRYPVGMLSIMYDRGPEQWDMTDQRLRRELGPATVEFLSKYCADLKQEFDDLQQPTEFSIGVDYRLTLTKRPNKADITLDSGKTGGEPTRIVEVPKDPSKSHPFRRTEVLELVGKRLQINSHDIQCVIKVYGIKDRPDFFYQGKVKNSPRQYSQAFVDWLVKRHGHDEQFFPKTRASAKNYTNAVASDLPSK